MSLLISCEAGGDAAPAQFIAQKHPAPKHKAKTKNSRNKTLLPGQLPQTLPSDAPAKHVAERMASQLRAPLVANRYSLDLIDVTRSPRHRQLFPSPSRTWPAEDRQRLIDLIYQPYRERVQSEIKKLMVRSSHVVHLSVRTFECRNTSGKLQRADVGLLYDPAVDDEVDLCLDWLDQMYYELPMLRVRRNYPRRGTSDSITQAMRGKFSANNYLGIEILLNRAWAARPVAIRDQAIDGICETLTAILGARHCKAA
jgi:hypothetical protein